MKTPPIAILAGGLATRLGDITKKMPKSMIVIAGHPFIHHQLTWLKSQGIEEVVICAGFLGEDIQKFVGDGSQYGLKVVFSFDGKKLLGTGGAIKKALPLLGDRFFVIYGDSYLKTSISRVLNAFLWSGKDALMTVYKNDGRFDKSNVEFNDNRIVQYSKKEDMSMHHIDYGLEVFSRKVFDKINLEEFDLALVHAQLVKVEQLAAFEVEDRFFEIGSPTGLVETNLFLGESIK